MDYDSRDFGDEVKIIPAKIKGGYVPVLVDDEDYDRLSEFTWGIIAGGYAARQVYSHSVKRPDRKRAQSHYNKIYMHREIMNAQAGQRVDHANRNKRDNQRLNLRYASREQNAWNTGPKLGSSSIYKGVSFASDLARVEDKPWVASIRASGLVRHLGIFATQEEAALAYNDAARELHGEFAFRNEMKELGL